jgi:hypothetical protein
VKVHAPAWKAVTKGLLAESDEACEEIGALLSGAEISWPEFVHFADLQYVTPGLWLALKRKQLVQQLPDEASQYLHAVYDMNVQRNSAIRTQLTEILAAMAAEGLTAVPIKGSALLQSGIYEDPGARVMVDLDLLVREDQLQQTARVLYDLGYIDVPESRDAPHKHHHLDPVYRPGDVASVEVHSEPLNRQARPLLSAAELWREVRKVSVDAQELYVPSATHCALLAIGHSEVADRNLGKLIFSLRAAQDVITLLDAEAGKIDWTEIERRMHDCGRAGVFEDFLYILNVESGHHALPRSRVTLTSRARHYGCQLASRQRWIGRWLTRLITLTPYRLELRYGDGQDFWSVQMNRLRLAGGFIGKTLRPARHKDD